MYYKMKLQEDDLNIYKVFNWLKLGEYQIRFGLDKVNDAELGNLM